MTRREELFDVDGLYRRCENGPTLGEELELEALDDPTDLDAFVIDGADHLFDGKTREAGEAIEDLLADFDA